MPCFGKKDAQTFDYAASVDEHAEELFALYNERQLLHYQIMRDFYGRKIYNAKVLNRLGREAAIRYMGEILPHFTEDDNDFRVWAEKVRQTAGMDQTLFKSILDAYADKPSANVA